MKKIMLICISLISAFAQAMKLEDLKRGYPKISSEQICLYVDSLWKEKEKRETRKECINNVKISKFALYLVAKSLPEVSQADDAVFEPFIKLFSVLKDYPVLLDRFFEHTSYSSKNNFLKHLYEFVQKGPCKKVICYQKATDKGIGFCDVNKLIQLLEPSGQLQNSIEEPKNVIPSLFEQSICLYKKFKNSKVMTTECNNILKNLYQSDDTFDGHSLLESKNFKIIVGHANSIRQKYNNKNDRAIKIVTLGQSMSYVTLLAAFLDWLEGNSTDPYIWLAFSGKFHDIDCQYSCMGSHNHGPHCANIYKKSKSIFQVYQTQYKKYLKNCGIDSDDKNTNFILCDQIEDGMGFKAFFETLNIDAKNMPENIKIYRQMGCKDRTYSN